MNVIGIIAEYNPFHNGHLYHINKIKEMYPNSILIAVISTSFLQRGEISLLNKWDKTKICLDNKIDLVIELPFIFSSSSADIFAKGAIEILNHLKVDTIIFGSESNDLNLLTNIAKEQVFNPNFDLKVKKYLDKSFNYPTAISLASSSKVNKPNDLLGISYIKEIIKNNYQINFLTIKRTNDYHSKEANSNIISASAIRNLLKENKSIKNYIPYDISNYLYLNTDIYPFLKYKIISDQNLLNIYQTVDEGIENRILKYINSCSSKEELITKIKCKRYTYNKINRMFIHILTSYTKKENNNLKLEYIRVLGFNKTGKNYLNKIKNNLNIKLITSYKNNNFLSLQIEKRVTEIYSIIVNDSSLIKKELEKPIIKED